MYQFQLISLSEYFTYLLAALWIATGISFISCPLTMLFNIAFDNDKPYKIALRIFLVILIVTLSLSAIAGLIALLKYLFTYIPQ